jgi:hypothetical protein
MFRLVLNRLPFEAEDEEPPELLVEVAVYVPDIGDWIWTYLSSFMALSSSELSIPFTPDAVLGM